MGQSCISFSSKKTLPPNGGVFKTQDKGVTWAQKTALLSSGAAVNFSSVSSINGFYFDPSDHSAIYALTPGNGLLYSYSGGEGWSQPSQMATGPINSIAIDPKDKCTIYLGVQNKIAKSIDCNRSYDRIYQDTRGDSVITNVVVDFYNPTIVYAGNSYGDFLKSTDSGMNWKVVYRFGNKITKMVMDNNDSRIFYAAVDGLGMQKTTNAGEEWIDLSDALKDFPNARTFRDMVMDPTQKNTLFYANRYGLLKTTDGGTTWTDIPLLTPPSSTDIKSLVINPKNSLEIYYITATTFYSSNDGGATWQTQKLPTAFEANVLGIDPEAPENIFLGVKALAN